MKDLAYLTSRTTIDPIAGCWVWQKAVQKCGYGKAKFQDKIQSSHRIAWQLAFGPIPDGAWVLHKCDNKLCCNPEHLFLGDVKSNTADKVARQRQNRGESVPQSKLTEAEVLEIRARYPAESVMQLARAFSISHSKISMIVQRKNWRHI